MSMQNQNHDRPRDVGYATAALASWFPKASLAEIKEAASFWVETRSPIFAQIQLDRAAVNLRKLRGAKQ